MSGELKGTVLVVDDNEPSRYGKRRLLEASGQFRVLEAGTGAAALALAASERPDLVLLDIQLPDIDGFEVCRRLRADMATSSIAIVHITASFERPEDQVRGLEAGADTFMLAPVDPSVLIATTRAMIRLRRAEAALREADRRKDEFLAVLAHELRNPLAPLRNSLQLLARQPDKGPLMATAIDIMTRQIGQMVRLIDDLLDVSRINENKLELRPETTTVARVLESALETTRSQMEAAGQDLEVNVPSEPIPLHGDPMRLSQIFANLLSNATKYTPPEGRIVVTARREDDVVSIDIVDSGVGIAPEDMSQIFRMFAQVRRDERQQGGGLGIGLALVRRLVEMHGGTVSAQSAGRGQGSTFTVRLPIAQPAASTASARSVRASAPLLPWQRVLVVDDNVDAAESLSLLLGGAGAEVRVAHDGMEALRIADGFRPELVLMDIAMPRLNGLQTSRTLKQQPWAGSLVICAITGYGQTDDRARSAAAGIDFHLVKPIDVQSLCAMRKS